MIRPLVVPAFLALFAAPVLHAEVKQSAADGFLVTYTEPLSASTAKAYADITQVQRWWSSEHTWSGKASNLSLKAEAGGCFCERWSGGSAEHGRVIMALPGKLLRLEAALGPLQEFALNGVLSFWLKNEEGATSVTVEYRVNGASASALDAIAPTVDEVLGAQVARLKRYVGTGNPEAPAENDGKDGAKPDAAAKPKPAEAKKKAKPTVAPVKP